MHATSVVRDLLAVAHAGIWMYRQTPATVLNEIGHILELSLDQKLPKLDAEKMAVQWDQSVRKMLYKFSQARPLEQGDLSTFSMWQETFLFLESKSARSSALPSDAAGPSTGQQSETPKQDFCLWHMIFKCTQSRCGRLHSCPICHGVECGNRAAPLAWHLGELKKPQKIVPISTWQRGAGREDYRDQDDWPVRRERSRSPRRGKGQERTRDRR